MSLQTSFEVRVGQGTVSGTLSRPDAGNAANTPLPAVLFCWKLPGQVATAPDLRHALVAGLVEHGLAAIEFAPRQDDSESRLDAGALVDDASAIFRWMLLDERVDDERIGLVAFGPAAVIAAGLAAQARQLERLALIAPATATDVATRAAKSNGLMPLLEAHVVSEAFVTSIGELTPTEDVVAHQRPVLIVGGAADRVLGPASAEAYLTALERGGEPVVHELVARADHEITSAELRAIAVDRVRSFFEAMPIAAGSASGAA